MKICNLTKIRIRAILLKPMSQAESLEKTLY